MLKKRAAFVALAFLVTCTAIKAAPPDIRPAFRPPAVPLVTCDPYLSIWSMADRLTDDTTRHWTRREHPLVSLILIDGEHYRLMGTEPKNLPAMRQVGVRVMSTRSIYDFDDEHVHVTLTFLTPALPDNLDVLARPLTYLTWNVRSVDGIAHAVSIYDSTSALLTVNSPEQKVAWARAATDGLTVLSVGTVEQTLLQPTRFTPSSFSAGSCGRSGGETARPLLTCFGPPSAITRTSCGAARRLTRS